MLWLIPIRHRNVLYPQIIVAMGGGGGGVVLSENTQ